MDYYLFAARSVTHAQRMARRILTGTPSSLNSRAGNAITGHGCGYTLEVSAKYFARAAQACRAGGVLPVKALLSSNGTMREVAL